MIVFGSVQSKPDEYLNSENFTDRFVYFSTPVQEFGEVKAARLAYRFRRPLGYAFVTLADPSAANAALVKVLI